MTMLWRPFDKEIKKNPYLHYQEVAEKDSVIKHFPIVYVLDYDNVKHIFKNSIPFSSMKQPPKSDLDLTVFMKVIKYILFQFDGEFHKDLRDLGTYGIKGINFQHIVEQEVARLVQVLKAKQEFDFVKDYSAPLSVHVTCHMLGVPFEDGTLIEDWGRRMFKIAGLYVNREDFNILKQAAGEINDYIRNLVKHKSYIEGNNLIANLVNRYKEQNELEENLEKIVSWCTLLIFSALETSSGAMSNSIYNLLNHPKEFERLKANPKLLPTAIEELLRYDTPLQFVSRMLTENTTLNNQKLYKGQLVAVCLGAANRDRTKFDQPNRLILDRKPNRHIAFGTGEHYCFGARIAKIELAQTIKAFIEHFPTLSLSSKLPEYKSVNVLKAFSSLRLSTMS